MLDVNEVKKYLYKSKAPAHFSHYVSGNLYYVITLEDGLYQFPIPTVENLYEDWDKPLTNGMIIPTKKVVGVKLSSDLGTTTFDAEIKGIHT